MGVLLQMMNRIECKRRRKGVTVNSNNIKIFNTPSEAAIRWINLSEQDGHILDRFNPDRMPSAKGLEGRPLVCLSLGRKGITCAVPELLSTPNATNRQVELCVWMTENNQRPRFLFDEYTFYRVSAKTLSRNIYKAPIQRAVHRLIVLLI